MIGIYAGILAVVVLIISVVLSLLYTDGMYEDKRASLQSSANMVNQTMGEYLDGTIGKERLSANIDMIGYIADARIYAMRYSEISTESLAKQLTEGTSVDETLLEDLRRILAGTQVFHSKIYSAKLDTEVVFAGIPLVYQTKIIGGILIYAPLDRVVKDVFRMNLIVFGIAMIMFFLGTLGILLWTKRLIRPILRMQDSAAALASGEKATSIDVSGNDEIGRLAMAFNHMQDQLQKTEEVRKSFIANVSHELRTPLTSIRGFLQSLLDGLVKEENKRDYLQIMMGEVLRLNKLTLEILELAKLQSGTTKLVKEQVDVAGLIHETILTLQGLADEKAISLTSVSRAPAMAFIDPDKMKQVFVNLIGNAIKFTQAGGHILVDCSWGQDNKNMTHERLMTISVEDNGMGIPADEIPTIFDKFRRVDPSGNPLLGGTGLGLSIAKEIVEMHHGKISAQSTTGKGSIFTVVIPEI